MTTTASTSSNLPDKDQIRIHVQRNGSIERQRFNALVWRQLCKYDGGEECQTFVAYRSLCVGHYHQTSVLAIETPLTVGLKNWRRKIAQPNCKWY
ncbi:unnamed protein product [Rotaria sp. Silwood2]|nr:unnamed protein product [Rotaria sp. Silwood2]